MKHLQKSYADCRETAATVQLNRNKLLHQCLRTPTLGPQVLFSPLLR